MHKYEWDPETGGILLSPQQEKSSKEPRPVYYREMNLLGMDQRWHYTQNDDAPIMWAEAEKYIYRGKMVARAKGGSLYTAPEIVYTEGEEGEPEGAELIPCDVPVMVEKNRELMNALAEESVKKLYNTYRQYRNKVDIFHVSYSGGKDSEVMLDIVQRAVPHNEFIVIFGDTKMEFPDTYEAVAKTKEMCKNQNIAFYTAKTHFSPSESWNIFGPPASKIRWCCSVHKTAPQLLKLREIVGKSDFREMAFVGVRAAESAQRSSYEYISLGTKHKGQYSCNPILDWNSAEVYLHIFENNLPLNKTYTKGNSRAGCLVCPMSGDKSDFIRHCCYPKEVDSYIDIVRKVSTKVLETPNDTKRYIETGGWKVRTNGRDIKTLEETYTERLIGNYWEIKVKECRTDWQQWIKTAGILTAIGDGLFQLENHGITIDFSFEKDEYGFSVKVEVCKDPKKILLVKSLKEVFRKAAYCHFCRECEADCQHGYIHMTDDGFYIDDECVHCGNCHKPDGGCLIYKSIELPKGTGIMNNKSLDSYADHAPKMEWFEELFAKQDEFFTNFTLGSEMINKFLRFLRDAEFAEKKETTAFGKKCFEIGLSNVNMWGLMLVNLSYSPELNWYITHIKQGVEYTREQISEMLANEGVKVRGAHSITGAYKRILALPFGNELGLGTCTQEGKEYIYKRDYWINPESEVILYSLYKFAEACGDYYQFTLSYLMDETIERDGVSPTTIFGLDRDTMIRILNGLSINYPEFISVSFHYGLETITLRKDKKPADVLELI